MVVSVLNEKPEMSCVGCSQAGVTICAACSKKSRYRQKAAARGNPLEKRSPQLYKHLDELSRSPLDGNKRLWDEFCIEIRADHLYEHLPILVEIVQEGKWRTDSLKPKIWLLQQFVNRVGKTGNNDDYDRNGRRRAEGPKFDKRNGALISCETRPYVEFEIRGDDGETLAADEAIDGRLARAQLQNGAGGCQQLLADRESLRALRGRTYAESIESDHCERLYDILQQDKPAFDIVLAEAIQEQRPLTTNLGLDPDEAEVLALAGLLWSVGPRVYLKFVDQSDRKRLRNAWYRVDRKRKNHAFKQTLRDSAQKTRREWEGREWEYLFGDPPDRPEKYYQDDRRVPPKRDLGGCDRCGALDSRLCTCEVGGERKRKPKPEVQRQLRSELERQMGVLLPPSPSNTPEFVDEHTVILSCDIDEKQRALYRSSAKKPQPGQASKLSSE